MPYFEYGQESIAYLKEKDLLLGGVIDQIGPIQRTVNPNLFESLINSIIGQQISTKAQATIWHRMKTALGEITPSLILSLPADEIQAFGLSFRKVEYMKQLAMRVDSGALHLKTLHTLEDDAVCATLCELPGIGVWTAEMLMIFSMGRQNVFSFGDFAIRKGLRMLYHHREITKPLFEKYRRRYAPYGSVASLYLWSIAGGAVEGMQDYAPKTKGKK